MVAVERSNDGARLSGLLPPPGGFPARRKRMGHRSHRAADRMAERVNRPEVWSASRAVLVGAAPPVTALNGVASARPRTS